MLLVQIRVQHALSLSITFGLVFEFFGPSLQLRSTAFHLVHLQRQVDETAIREHPFDGLKTSLQIVELDQHRILARRRHAATGQGRSSTARRAPNCSLRTRSPLSQSQFT